MLLAPLVGEVLGQIQTSVRELQWPDLQLTVEEYIQNLKQGGPRTQARILLPALACLAVGGEDVLPDALLLAAAWEVFCMAAVVLDDAADKDKPNRTWSQWDVERSMNVGVGLIFLGQKMLAELNLDCGIYKHILRTVNAALIEMAKGQALPPHQPVLDNYLRHIAQKTGIFYAAFAQAGAILASNDQQTQQAFF